MKRIPAFTLIELIVSLIIGSIVTGILYYAYLLFDKQFRNYQSKSAWVNEFILFQKAFRHDLDVAYYVRDSVGQTIVFENESGESEVLYEFSDSVVSRHNSNGSNIFTLKSRLININYVTDSIALVKAIAIGCNIDGQVVKALFEKKYSAQQIIKYQTKNE